MAGNTATALEGAASPFHSKAPRRRRAAGSLAQHARRRQPRCGGPRGSLQPVLRVGSGLRRDSRRLRRRLHTRRGARHGRAARRSGGLQPARRRPATRATRRQRRADADARARATSPAVDAAQANGFTTDQRGLPRTATRRRPTARQRRHRHRRLRARRPGGSGDDPDTEFKKKPKKKVNLKDGKKTAKVKLKFTGTDNSPPPGPLTFECKVDKGKFDECKSPLKLRDPRQGQAHDRGPRDRRERSRRRDAGQGEDQGQGREEEEIEPR